MGNILNAAKIDSRLIDKKCSNWDQDRITDIFERLDQDKDGKIDMNELILALGKHGVKASTIKYAKNFFDEADLNKDGLISLQEFTYYMESHERKLRSIYDTIHHDDSPGANLNAKEIVDASNKFGITISEGEAEELLKEMQIHGVITWEIWRDFFILSTNTNMVDTIEFWRNHTIYSDMSETGAIPKDTFHGHRVGAWWKYIVSGGLAGCISRTFTAPLDRIKVFMQTHEMHTAGRSHGIKQYYKEFMEEGGWRSFWRGNGISVMKATPEYAIKCTVYEKMKDLIRGPGSSRDLKIFERFIAGSMAGGICETAIYPLELLKTRSLLRKTGEYAKIPELIRYIYKTEGPRGFYKGYTLSLTGIVPMAGLDLMMYESMKKTYLKKLHHYDEIERNSKIPYSVLVICGVTSTTVGLFFTYPIVLLKTRMQAAGAFNLREQQSDYNSPRKPKEYKLQYNIKKIWKESGPTGFYRGIMPCLLKVIPAVSISYLVYEKSLEVLGAKMM